MNIEPDSVHHFPLSYASRINQIIQFDIKTGLSECVDDAYTELCWERVLGEGNLEV